MNKLKTKKHPFYIGRAIITLEFVWQNIGLGLFYHKTYEPGNAFHNLWLCFLPMLSIHIKWRRKQ